MFLEMIKITLQHSKTIRVCFALPSLYFVFAFKFYGFLCCVVVVAFFFLHGKDH